MSAHGSALVRVQSAETLIGTEGVGIRGRWSPKLKVISPALGCGRIAEAPLSPCLRWEYFCSPADRGSGSAAGRAQPLLTLPNMSRMQQYVVLYIITCYYRSNIRDLAKMDRQIWRLTQYLVAGSRFSRAEATRSRPACEWRRWQLS